MIYREEIFKIIENFQKPHKMNKEELYFRIGDQILKTFYKPFELELIQIPFPNTYEILKYNLIKSNIFNFYKNIFENALDDNIIDNKSFEFLLEKIISILDKHQERKQIEKKKLQDILPKQNLIDRQLSLISNIISDLRLDMKIKQLSDELVKTFLSSSHPTALNFDYKKDILGICAGAIFFASRKLKIKNITYKKVADIAKISENTIKKWIDLIENVVSLEKQAVNYIRFLKLTNFFYKDLEIPLQKGTNIILLPKNQLKEYYWNRPSIYSKQSKNYSFFEASFDEITSCFPFSKYSKKKKNWRIDLQLNVKNEIIQIIREYEKDKSYRVSYNNISSKNLIFNSNLYKENFHTYNFKKLRKEELKQELMDWNFLLNLKDNYLTKSILNEYLFRVVRNKGFENFLRMKKYFNRNREIFYKKFSTDFVQEFNKISDNNFYGLFKNNKLQLKLINNSLKIKRDSGNVPDFKTLTIEEIYKIIFCFECIFSKQSNGFYIIDEINDPILEEEEILIFIEKIFKNQQLIILTPNQKLVERFTSANIIYPEDKVPKFSK